MVAHFKKVKANLAFFSLKSSSTLSSYGGIQGSGILLAGGYLFKKY
jgi:hypothetical protein